MSERIGIVGPGRMGLALGAALAEGGAAEHITYFGRALEPPPHPLLEASHIEYRLWPQPIPPGITIVILAVPDDAISDTAADLAAAGQAPPGCTVLHLAGALSTDVLGPLHAAGYAIGSLHPLQTVADPWSGSDRLAGSTFALAGEPAALAAGRRLVSAIGGRTLVIPPQQRPIYHAAAVFASNYLVAMTGAMVRLLAQAGVDTDDAVPALLPLLRGTLENIEQLGISAALTGPIARGDLDTIRLHLSRLSPDERELYCALGRETLRLARDAGLDGQRAAEIESLFFAD